jgi:CBS domain-containing protein
MKNLLARDVMTPHVVTVVEDMSTHDLARFLVEHEISGAPVVDDHGRLVGVVSMTDIVRSDAERDEDLDNPAYYRGDPYEVTLEDLGQKYVEQQAVTVREVMTPAVHSVADTAPVSEVAGAMLDRHVHRLIVMRGQDPVGIITSLDLLRMLAGQQK